MYKLKVLLATCKQSLFRRLKYKKSGKKYVKPSWGRTPILKKCPQAKGIVTRVVTMTPKKPNSAIRHVAKVNLMNGLRVTARLPGRGYLCTKYNRVLIEGGRANDLPGVGYTAVRGVYDFSPVVGKIKRRSIYGVSRPNGFTKFIRRSLRRI
jgi:small subunit ribosomal protein S12